MSGKSKKKLSYLFYLKCMHKRVKIYLTFLQCIISSGHGCKKRFALRSRVLNKQDGNVQSRRHILGSKIFKEQLCKNLGNTFFSKKLFLKFFSKKSIF